MPAAWARRRPSGVLILGLLCWVSFAAAAPAGQAAGIVQYARLQHACPAPQSGRASCMAVAREPVPASSADAAGVRPYVAGAGAKTVGLAGGFTPEDLATAYGYTPTVGGANQTIGIVDAYDDPDIEANLKSFDEHYGLGECTGCFQKVDQEGKASPLPIKDPEGWSQEISLDVEVARSACHECHILLVEADSPEYKDLAAAVNEAVKLGATEVSNSYGGPEKEIVKAGVRADYEHPGVVITAAGGDLGYDDWNYALEGIKPPAVPDAPASLPSVVAVGGTSLELNENGTRKNETVWNDDGPLDGKDFPPGYVAGSGCSTLFEAEPFQQQLTGFAATGCGSKRSSVDVSADADPYTGFDIFDTFNYCKETAKACTTKEEKELTKEIEKHGGWQTFGGTSLATPLIAGLYALAGGEAGLKYPAALPLYGHLGQASLFDVTQGGTGYCDGEPVSVCGHPNTEVDPPLELVVDCEGTSACDARTGYDGPSGVGTPNGLEAFKPLFPTAVITPPATVEEGEAATFGSASSSDPYPGGAITGWLWKWGDGTETTGVANPTHTYPEACDYHVSLTVTDNYGLTSSQVEQVVHVSGKTEGEEAKCDEAEKRAEEAQKAARQLQEAKERQEAKETQEAKEAKEARERQEALGAAAAINVASFHSVLPPPVPDATLASTSLQESTKGTVTLKISRTRGFVTL